MASKYLIFITLFLIASLSMIQDVFAKNLDDSGFLWLVNRENRLSSEYKPVNLCEHQGIRVQTVACKAFMQMLEAMEDDGVYGLRLQSAYRTYGHQHGVFSQKKQELRAKGHSDSEAEIIASKSVQPPGASEHQLGLALDVAIDGTLTQAFGETKAGKWLEEHCHNFGFIIRYPNSKTEITQIIYEPWHLRYVGIPHATIMKNLELTLEEYLSYIKQAQTYIVWGESIKNKFHEAICAEGMNMEYYLISYFYGELPLELPLETIDVSSLSPDGLGKNEYIVTMRKTYPRIWETQACLKIPRHCPSVEPV